MAKARITFAKAVDVLVQLATLQSSFTILDEAIKVCERHAMPRRARTYDHAPTLLPRACWAPPFLWPLVPGPWPGPSSLPPLILSTVECGLAQVTSRRVNALDTVVIPKITNTVEVRG